MHGIEEGSRKVTEILAVDGPTAVVRAEVDWLEAVIGDLESGRLAWTYEQLAAMAQEDFFQATQP